MPEACFKCGTRGSCRHRQVDEPIRVEQPEKTDGRKVSRGQGLAFRKYWGKR